MNIHKADPTDLHGIQECAKAAYGMYVERIGTRPAPMTADFGRQIADGKVHVLSVDNAVAGFAVFYPREDHIHLENVAVHPDFQGMGYGLKLITYTEQYASDTGVCAVELYTNVRMTENLSLYPRLGYEEQGRGQEDGFDRVYFRKTLTRHNRNMTDD